MTVVTRRSALALMGSTLAATKLHAQTKPKIAFMMNGTPGPLGWNFEHQRGVEMVREAYGSKVQIDTIYDVKEWGKGDAEVLKELVGDGYSMIFACSFGYMKSVIQAAFQSPDVLFEHCGGYVRARNISTYTARWYEGRVIEGLLAGHMTKSNKIGYIGSFPIAQIMRGVNSAFGAARSVNPDVEMQVTWVNTWFNPEKEAAAARELASRGVDVILNHANTAKHVEVAEELGIYALGKASDMSPFGPNATLSSTLNNWGPYYVRRVGEFLESQWATKETWGGLAEEMIAIAPINGEVPSRVSLQVLDTMDKLKSREVSAFTGPIRRQDGSGWLAAGETASDRDLLTMDFFVEGITSVIPTTG